MNELHEVEPRRPVRYYIVKTDPGDQPLVRSVAVARPISPAPTAPGQAVSGEAESLPNPEPVLAKRLARAAAAIRHPRHPRGE